MCILNFVPRKYADAIMITTLATAFCLQPPSALRGAQIPLFLFLHMW